MRPLQSAAGTHQAGQQSGASLCACARLSGRGAVGGQEEPMKSVFQRLWELDQMDGILMASYTVGFVWGIRPAPRPPWPSRLERKRTVSFVFGKRKNCGDLVVENREKFQFAVLAPSPDDAVQRSIEEEEVPVYVSDSGDNPQAGATGCNTVMLENI